MANDSLTDEQRSAFDDAVKDIDLGTLPLASVLPQVIYGQDGDQITAYRPGFVNLQESFAGFGNTYLDALLDLERQEMESYPKSK